MLDIAAVLAVANDRHRTNWSLVTRLAGGYQQGAYELRAPGGGRAVLKWHARDLPARHLEDTARAIEEARSRSWPTPRWLAHGSLSDDSAYIVEEFIEGARPKRLEAAILERLLRAIRLQAGARPRTDQDWSSYIHRVVFEGEADLASRMRSRPETATLLRRLEDLTADARDLRLPSTDLVHGDFVLNNMLVRDGVPYLVDTAHAGKGTRAYDLATLLMETTVGGDYGPPSIAQQRQLRDECVAIVGWAGLRVNVAGRMLHLLVFGGDHWGEHVPPLVAKCHAFLDGLDA